MRPDVLNTGYRRRAKLLFKLIEMFSREPLPDAAKLTYYRADFHGSPAKRITHVAMRGESAWTVGERELMAAYVSSINHSRFCVGAHSGALFELLSRELELRSLDVSPDTSVVSCNAPADSRSSVEASASDRRYGFLYSPRAFSQSAWVLKLCAGETLVWGGASFAVA